MAELTESPDAEAHAPADPMLHPEEVEGAPKAARPSAWRWLMYVVALGLFGLCIWMGIGEAAAGWQKVREAEAGQVIALVALTLGSLVMNTWVFWAVIIPFRPNKPVGVGEMGALICASSLLNYLPMRAGMIGRAAYLKQQHNIGYRLSVVMMVFVAGSTAAVYAWLSLVTWCLREAGFGSGLGVLWWAASIGGMLAGAAVAWALIRYGRPLMPKFVLRYFDDAELAIAWFHRVSPVVGVGSVFFVLATRAADVGFVAARLWIIMDVLNEPLDPASAMLLATGGMFVTLATPLPNGLGLRDYIYGEVGQNQLLGLFDRAVEAVIFIITGMASMVYIHRRTTRRAAANAAA